MLLVVGDLNARTSSVSAEREGVLGKEGFGTIIKKAERLVEICQENNLVIGGRLSQHKDTYIDKLTWKSPDERTVSQIDHIIINQIWRRSLQDVKARRIYNRNLKTQPFDC